MCIYSEIESLVNSGETTWENVIKEIIRVKCESKLNNVKSFYFPIEEFSPVFEHIPGEDNFSRVELDELKEKLSKDAKTVIEYLNELLNPISIRGRLKLVLRKRFGWGQKKINSVISEIETYVKNLGEYE